MGTSIYVQLPTLHPHIGFTGTIPIEILTMNVHYHYVEARKSLPFWLLNFQPIYLQESCIKYLLTYCAINTILNEVGTLTKGMNK